MKILRNFIEIIRKDVIYENSKSHRQTGFQPLGFNLIHLFKNTSNYLVTTSHFIYLGVTISPNRIK